MIRQQLRRLRNRLDRLRRPGGRGLILLYHRVADEVSDPYGLCVTPAHFEQHLQAIRDFGTPMRVGDMVEAAAAGTLVDRAVGVTFDDGYLDNFEIAAPLLERYDIPATIFVTTGRGGRDREFWWDELDRIFFRTDRLPETLEIEIGSTSHRWSLSDGATFDPNQQEQRTGHLNDRAAPTARHATFREIYLLLQPLDDVARGRVLDDLLLWAGDGPERVRQSRRVMTPAQVTQLAERGLVQIGAHTITHPALPARTQEDRRAEVEESKATVEAWLGREVASFAYPYGLYDSDSIATVRDAGFRFACAGDHRAVWSGDNPLLLPRVDVPPRSGDVVARLLHRYLS